MLETVYVWHGKGSLKSERGAAMNHAQLIKREAKVVEVRQGREDETFWMVILSFNGNDVYLRIMTDAGGELHQR